MKKLLSDKAFLIELVSFVVLQIFIDMYRVFLETRFQIMGISLPEVVNIAFFVFLSLVFFIKNLKTPKRFIPIGVYTVLVGVYLILHTINILKFDQNIFTGSELNWFKEIYFIARTYLIPIYVFYYFLTSSFQMGIFKKTISIMSLIISANIVLTNIFKVSFICYASALEKNEFITRNIFEWFYNPDKQHPEFMTSKGWFYMGNQIGIILFMLFVFVLMNALQSGKIRSYLLMLLNGVALIMVGTKVALLGGALALGIGFIFAIVFGVHLKQFTFKLKQGIAYVVISIILAVLVAFSPMISMQSDRMEAYELSEEQKKCVEQLKGIEISNLDEEFIKEFTEYVNRFPYSFGIEKEFLQLFPIEDNFSFWYYIAISGNKSQIDFRYMKSKIYEEGLEKNQNKVADRLLGIGYISAFPYSEKDFVSQNMWFGYIGSVLLIGPYILVALYGAYLALKRREDWFNYQNAIFAMGICATLAICLLAGHLFYGVFSITIFGFVVAAFYKLQKGKE